ncbi:MAG TPA: hypothetical protein VJ921_04685 [Vicinamibacteria bacterium]|nr:hypothetical protein [Vicinamibacteria bacterium]
MGSPVGMDRRDFLQLGISGLVSAAGFQTALPLPVPRVNGGINIQPYRRLEPNAGFTPPLILPGLVDAQMKALYELGYEHVRLTLSFDRFGPDFVAGIPYVRAARALGMDVLGVIGQFTGYDLVQAIADPATRDEVFETYVQIFGDAVPAASPAISAPGGFSVQILNEPTHFLGIAPDAYVHDYLRPAFYHLKEDDPTLRIVSAAEIGSAAGVLQSRRMIEAGLELYCDRVAFHLYSEAFLEEVAGVATKPVWVTESGSGGAASHREWMTASFDRIRRAVPGTEQIFWFQLFDSGTEGFRLIDLAPTLDGGFEAVSESEDALDWLRSRVTEALAGVPAIPYRDLVPDITLYFPTEEDFRILAATSFGEIWRS